MENKEQLSSPYEHADEIAKRYGGSKALQDDILAAIFACCNADMEKRRALEAELTNMRVGFPVIVADKDRTQLRVWNTVRQQWAELDMIHIPREMAHA